MSQQIFGIVCGEPKRPAGAVNVPCPDFPSSIALSLERIKADPLGAVGRDLVEGVCRQLGYRWRERELDPATTVALFVQQVLHENCPCTEVRHLCPAAGVPGTTFTAQAYCLARKRLPLAAYQAILSAVCDAAGQATREPAHLWRGIPGGPGHRVWFGDGTTFSMPDTPELQKAFGQPSGQKPGCGFPVAHLLVLFSMGTGMLMQAVAAPLRTGDLAAVPALHPHLEAGDVLLGDDSFSSYVHLALLMGQGLHGLFPVHHARTVDFTPDRPHSPEGAKAVAGLPRSRWVAGLGVDDQVVEYFKPKDRPRWCSKALYDSLPASILVRETRRTVEQAGVGPLTLTTVTTLTDPVAYPAEALMGLRQARWGVETDIGHLKTTMGMDVLHCKTEAGVRKEPCVFCLVYNLVRVVMLEAARRQEVAVGRVSFADAYRWMSHARPGDAMPALLVNPLRPGRPQPRAKKRRPKQYDLLNKPREKWREQLRAKRKVA